MIIADTLLLLHVLIVIFVVAGLVAVYAGKAFNWSWVRNPWFRLVHIATIAIVVIQSWAGVICPLTTMEMSFRSKAGDQVYSDSFIAHWLSSLLYYQAPAWVFTLVYTLFGALVLASWFYVRPRPFKGSKNKK